jgi:prepilin-type N-terminal cleavage/methylation domain-containing protein
MKRHGFTLIELTVVIGIVTGLVIIASVNLLGSYRKSNLNSTITTLTADIKQQQLKSMLGDTEGRAAADTYGIYFGNTNYVLFHGAAYNPASSDNFTIDLASGLTFTAVSFPNSVIIFSRGGGEVASFTAGSNTFALTYPQGDSKTFTFNRYGTLTQVN